MSDVIILRLIFETDGKTYNLGVVDNKMTGDGKPANKQPKFDFIAWLADLLGMSEFEVKALLYGLPILLILCVALPVLSALFPAFGKALKAFFKGLWTVIKTFFKGL